MFFIRKYGLFIVFGFIIFIGAIFINREKEEELDVVSTSDNSDSFVDGTLDDDANDETEDEPVDIIVDIKGAVLNPGIYTVDDNTRMDDVIELAGGLSEEADQKQINLAERIHDEMYIYIPEEGEEDMPDATLVQTTSGSGEAERIRINQATPAELEELDGVGPSKAQAIIDHIDENGPLSDEDDLLEISGIGEKTLDKFQDKIIVP